MQRAASGATSTALSVYFPSKIACMQRKQKLCPPQEPYQAHVTGGEVA